MALIDIDINHKTSTPSSALPGPSKLFFMGRVTYPYASAGPPLGQDGTCDEKWNGSVWSLTNVLDTGVAAGNVMATGCYDSTTKLIYLFGDWDGVGRAKIYNTLTDDYTEITALPSTTGGNATFAACYSGNCFIFSGMKSDGTLGFTTTIQKYPINAGTPSQSYTSTSAVMPYAGKDIFGAVDSTSPNLVWLGGGSTDTSDPPVNSTAVNNWVLYDMSSPNTNPVAKTNIPTGLAQAACVDIGSEILLIGGCVTGTPNTVGTQTVRAYNKSGNSWSTKANYPIPVACARATFFNGVIYCAGGFNATGFDINANPPNASSAVYMSSDLGASWQLHSNLVDAGGGAGGSKASGSSILVAQ